MKMVVPIILIAGILAGCATPTVVSGDANGVWIQQGVVSVGSPDSRANAWCGQFGKTAWFQSRLHEGRVTVLDSRPGNFTPIYAYDCR